MPSANSHLRVRLIAPSHNQGLWLSYSTDGQSTGSDDHSSRVSDALMFDSDQTGSCMLVGHFPLRRIQSSTMFSADTYSGESGARRLRSNARKISNLRAVRCRLLSTKRVTRTVRPERGRAKGGKHNGQNHHLINAHRFLSSGLIVIGPHPPSQPNKRVRCDESGSVKQSLVRLGIVS